MQPVIAYLKDQVLPTDKDETYKLRRRSAHFLFLDDVLYKRSLSSPLLRCMGGDEATYILRKVHEGVCGNHSGGPTLVQKFHTMKGSSTIKKVRNQCDELGIKKNFSTPHHPQANGQVKAVNKTIKHVLKRKLDASKGAWVDELPQVL
ncbi:uncharacterized protein LOC111370000 [Olea europaea var. sylvestris]|uniref:uncharacterized protein LOC111370000 n=1 Tax=Olea europaea var. sylvestris TaxID=158386 RepID=UPI000C1D1A19|nr:uncharacterized protein LOC111370000 [Olea europaea var. sylvestris]